MRVRAHQSPGNLSNKDICLSWGANERDTNTECHGSEIETDENRHGDKCKGLVKE